MELSRHRIACVLIVLPYIVSLFVEAGGYAAAPNCCNIVCCCPGCGNNCGRYPPIGYAGECSCKSCTGQSGKVSWQPSGSYSSAPIPFYPPQPSYAPGPVQQPYASPVAPYASPTPPKYTTSPPKYATSAPVSYVTSTPIKPTLPPTYASPVPTYVTPAPTYVTPAPSYASTPPKYPTPVPGYASPVVPYVSQPLPIPNIPYRPAPFPFPSIPCTGSCNCGECPGFWRRVWNFFNHGWGLVLFIVCIILLILLCALLGALLFHLTGRRDQNRRYQTTVQPVGNPSRVTVNQSPTQP
ncbi:hypothetical protein M3Y95_00172900 [Aphelenchoides besseyi]|nr:hypothetical protein M3Y95_00172900 [Aphelenchoides besseyi]